MRGRSVELEVGTKHGDAVTFQNRMASIGVKVQVDVMVNAQGEVGVSADVEVDVGVNVSCR